MLYVGETSWLLHARISERMGISDYTGKAVYPSTLSSVLSHLKQTGHNVSFDNFSVLASGASQLDVLIRESLLISQL